MGRICSVVYHQFSTAVGLILRKELFEDTACTASKSPDKKNLEGEHLRREDGDEHGEGLQGRQPRQTHPRVRARGPTSRVLVDSDSRHDIRSPALWTAQADQIMF